MCGCSSGASWGHAVWVDLLGKVGPTPLARFAPAEDCVAAAAACHEIVVGWCA